MKMKLRLASVLVLLLVQITCFAAKQPERVEPAFWWVGMKNPNLQVMVYGENISELTPVAKYDGLKIVNVHKVKSPNYLFIDFQLAANIKPGSFKIEFQKDSKRKLSYEYKLLEREEGSAERIGYNTSDVMYLITPDRFANGNPNNDNIDGMPDLLNREDENGRHGGDIQGMINSLDYIKDMGFTAIWVNPLLENNQQAFSYHGYSTTDYYKVDPRYGSNEEYLEFVKLAKSKGIKIVMDMIENHCGSEHWWVKDLPTEDWFNFQEGFKQCIHRRETVQDPYASDWDKKMHADGWFVPSMPDLNQKNELMATYLIQNSIWWIEYAQLSGVRQDTYPYPDMDFMSDWTKAIMTEYPNFNIVGEEWSTNPSIIAYWQKGKKNPNGYESFLPGLMDFPLQHAMVEALNEDEAEYGKGIVKLYTMLSNDFVYADPTQLVVFPDNHDMSRIFTQLNEDFDLYKMAMAYIAVTRGIPQIYYGTEILMKNPGTDSHGVIRTDFPGGWKDDKVNAFSGEGLTGQQKEAQEYTKILLNWRKSCKTIHKGKLKHFAPVLDPKIYTMFRYDDEKIVMLVMNKNDEAKSIPLEIFKAELLGKANEGINVLTGEKVSLAGNNVQVSGRSVLLLEINK